MENKLDRIAHFWSEQALLEKIDISEFINTVKPIYDELIIFAGFDTDKYPIIYNAFYDTLKTYVETVRHLIYWQHGDYSEGQN